MTTKTNWQDSFPLNTFHGETKKQLVEMITGLISQTRKEEKERYKKFLQYHFKNYGVESVIELLALDPHSKDEITNKEK